jgi:tetratricopeptide (TPR) repeat protein
MLKRLGSLDGQDNLSLSDKVAIARGEDLDLVRKLTASGDFDAAIEACEPLTLTNPDALEVLIQLAKAVSLEGRHADAESLFSKAVFVCSSDPALLRERGINLFALKRYSDALKTFAKAMAIQPRNPSIVFNMGNAFGKLGQLAEANQCYELAALLEPTCPKIQNNRGNNYWRLKKYYESIECFDKAIALDPGYALAHNGKGVSLKALSHLYDAGEAFHKALSLDPDMADAHLNLGFVHLTLGDYIEGLRLYEWRRRVDRLSASFKHYPQPYLTPDCSLSGKVLFLYPEQGLGDFIQFMRFIPELLEQDSSVVLQTPRSLTQLVRAAFPRVSIIESDALPSHFDAHCSVVSLPYVLQTTPENISGARYLTADPEKIALWQEKLGERQGGRVGIVWSGNIDHKNDHNRSVALSDMLSIIDPSFEWHSLQVQYREDDEVTLSENPLIQDHRAELTDFSETAALIECMDLVITVDTSVAHLAGALGKPVWILVPKVPDFRWMMDSSETIWYDSARLYRQPVEGDWQTVIERIESDLTKAIVLRNH